MFSFIERPNIQENINKIATAFIFLFIISLPLGNGVMNVSLATILVMYFLGGNYAEKIQQIKDNPAVICFLLLFVWTVASAAYSDATPEFIKHDIFKYKKILLLPALIYFMNDKNLNAYIYAFLFGTVLMILYTFIFDHHGLVLSLQNKVFTYSANPLRNYISEGVFLSIALFASLWFIKNKIHTVWMVTLFVLFLVQIAFNNGRMALISVIFALLCFVFLSIKKQSTKLVLCLAVLILAYGAYLTTPLIQIRIDRTIAEASQITNFSTANSIRLQFWKMSWEKFVNGPIFGFGPGSFKQMTTDSGIPGEIQAHGHSHNEFLFISLQYGLIGLTLFLSGLFLTLRKFQFNTTSPARMAAFVGALIMLLNCITDSLFFAMTEGHVFIVMLAVYLSRDKSTSEIKSA